VLVVGQDERAAPFRTRPGRAQLASLRVIALVLLPPLCWAGSATAGTFFVTSSDPNADPGGIFAALAATGGDPGPHDIVFDIGNQTIFMTSTLTLGDGLNLLAINGTPTLDGTNAPGSANGIRLIGTGSSVNGLRIVNYGAASIEIRGSANTVGGCILGNSQFGVMISDFSGGGDLNDIGDSLFPNFIHSNTFGIAIAAGAEDNTVSANVIGIAENGAELGNSVGISSAGARTLVSQNRIAANTVTGITILGPATSVLDNIIGLDAAGMAAPNGIGISVNFGADGAIIGTPGHGNLISGNNGEGLLLGARLATVMDNVIGLDPLELDARPNLGTSAVLVVGSMNTIGGTGANELNTIAGNLGNGIHLQTQFATMNSVISNDIGAPRPNGGSGIVIEGPGNSIGDAGAAPGGPLTGNLITGNRSSGIQLVGQSAFGNLIDGNFIGNNTFNGISILDASDNAIGSVAANRIVDNGQYGVRIEAVHRFVERNNLRLNRISGNAMQGIKLLGSAHTGILPPTVHLDPGSVTGTALVQSAVDLFADGDDEGEFYITTVTADGAGNYESKGSLALWRGSNLTAIQTEVNGNTSEFSAPLAIPGGGAPGIGEVICLDGLDAAQVVAGSASNATGTAAMSVTSVGEAVRLVVNHTVANPTRAEIRGAAAGMTGPVVLDLGNASSPISADFDAEQFRAFTDDHYILISNAAQPNGAIRGQILCPEPVHAAQAVGALLALGLLHVARRR
jgi:hypothetical protein